MISLRVFVASGHYKSPGQVSQGAIQSSFPIAPPSCIQGFLESLTGDVSLSFRGQFAYGYERAPAGHGFLVRQIHISGGKDGVKGKTPGSLMEAIRTVKVETYFDLAYRVAVQGRCEEKVREALNGSIDRFGVLALGESFDIVNWMDEVPASEETKWIVPGTRMTLITKSGRGYDRITAEYGTFDFGKMPHWFGMESSEMDPDGIDAFMAQLRAL